MSLPSDRYLDPAKWLELKQERDERSRENDRHRDCEGCKHKAELWGLHHCELGLTTAGKNNMRRCARYKGRGD